MQKWEYRVEYFGSGIHYRDYELNSIGDDGWELVGVYREDGSCYAVFKRPK